MKELLKECVITQVSNGATAATTEVDSSVLDMQGFDAVVFIASLGTVTDASVLTLTAKENTANSTSGATAVTGGATGAVTASSNSNSLLVSDVIRPSKRYVFAALTRTAQNSVVNNIIAIQYRARTTPVTQSASVLASALSSTEA